MRSGMIFIAMNLRQPRALIAKTVRMIISLPQGNIQDYVRWQLNLRRLSTIDMLMAEYLIDSMDERGFITLSNDELFQSFDTMLSFYQIENVDLALKTLSLWLSKYKLRAIGRWCEKFGRMLC